jgi:thiol-disulfide isomerase/thioredoxin
MMLEEDCVCHRIEGVAMYKQINILALVLSMFLFESCLSLGNSRHDPPNLQKENVIPMNTRISFENLLFLDGHLFDPELIKNKYVLINFWGTWCPYCESERPSLQLFHEIHQDNFVVLTISLDKDTETVREFMAKNNFSFPVLLDTGMTLKTEFAQFVPVSYIMSPDGIIIARIEGSKKWNSEETLKVLKYMGWYTVP